MPFIFISYSHKDSEYANRLADSLEAKGLDVWIDERIDYGETWPRKIRENLDACSAFVVIMTGQAEESRWVQNELTRAQRLGKRIFPLLLEGDVWLALETDQYVDVRGAKLPPPRFYNGLAGLLSTSQPSATATTHLRERLRTELGELQRRYDNLTSRIAAVDTDLGRALDREHKLMLEERRAELAGKRDEVSVRMAQIERALAEQPASERAAPASEQRMAALPADIGKGEAQAKPTIQAKSVSSKPAKPIESERPAPATEQTTAAPPADVAKAQVEAKLAAATAPAAGASALSTEEHERRRADAYARVKARKGERVAPLAMPSKPAESARPDLLIIDKPLRLELVRVPAGEFLMGSDPAKDSAAWDDEKPEHRLSLLEYYIGKYPVTVSQFAVFAQAQNYQTEAEREGWGVIWTGKEWKKEKGASWRHPRGRKSDVAGKGDHPVTQVTWRVAQAFCEWAKLRLASEAEWEKAARGVDGRVYPWGNEAPTAELCNFDQNIGETTPVGRDSKGASPYGAQDMAGNVWEWTLSLWGKDSGTPQFGYPYKPTDGREDLQVDIDIMRVVRGGSFYFNDRLVRCAVRSCLDPYLRNDDFGFRVVCVSPPHHASGL